MTPLAPPETRMIPTRAPFVAAVVALGLVLTPALAKAQSAGTAPAFLPVQGFLTDAAGQPIDGQTDLTLSLYATAIAGSVLYQETQTVMVDHGFFTLYLGQNWPLDLSLFRDHGQLFLGVQVGTDAQMSPRLVLGTTPYAAFAQYAGDAASVGGIPASQLQKVGQGVNWTDIQNRPAGLDDGDDDTTYTTGAPLTLDATAGNRIGLMSCASGQVLKATSGGWGCAADVSGLTTETDPTVNALAKASLSCAAGQVPKWGGSSWSCQNDLDTTRTNADLQSTLDPRYVNVTGDAMTGALAVDTTGSGTSAVTVTGDGSGALGQNAALSVVNQSTSTTASETAIAADATSGGALASALVGKAGSAASAYAYAVEGVASKAANNIGGSFLASGGTNAYGIMAQAVGGSNVNYAGYFRGDVMVSNGRYRYAAPVTGSVVVSPPNCVTEAYGGGIPPWYGGATIYDTAGSAVILCPVSVPSGVTLTHMTCTVIDNNGSDNLSVVLGKASISAGSASPVTTLTATTNSASVQTLSAALNLFQDNTTQRLSIRVSFNTNMEFRACVFTYQATEVLP